MSKEDGPFVSGFSYQDGDIFWNGPWVHRTPEGEEVVRQEALKQLRQHGGYHAIRLHEVLNGKPQRERYWRPVSEVEKVKVNVWICPFRGEPCS